jgi:uncharacterized membrane protein YecN with MAPEG domain
VGTADIYEIIWSLIAWGSFLVALYFAFDSYRDRDVQRIAQGDPASIALATSNMINALSKSVAFALYGTLGVYLMTVPNPDGVLTLRGRAIRLILIGGQLILFGGMTYNQIIRKRVLDGESKQAAIRLKEAAELAAMHLAKNTDAIRENTATVQQVGELIRDAHMVLPVIEWDERTHKDRRKLNDEGERSDASG